MAKFPRINSLCPLSQSELGKFENSFCRHCRRTVHNLDHMEDSERAEFMEQCKGTVCVSYTVKAATVAAAMAFSGAMTTAAIFATDVIDDPRLLPQTQDVEPMHLRILPGEIGGEVRTFITAGVIVSPQNISWAEHTDNNIPDNTRSYDGHADER
jgi:hypothetical protein